MAWSNIVGLFRGQNKRPAERVEGTGEDSSPESAALRRALHSPADEPQSVEEPEPQVLPVPAAPQAFYTQSFEHPPAEPVLAKLEEIPALEPPSAGSDAHAPEPHATFLRAETAAHTVALEPSDLEINYLEHGYREPGYLERLYPASNHSDTPERTPPRFEPTPISAPHTPAHTPVPEIAATAPASEPDEFAGLADRWAAARRSGSRPVYAVAPEPPAPEPLSWAKVASAPPPPPMTAARFAAAPPVVEAPAPTLPAPIAPAFTEPAFTESAFTEPAPIAPPPASLPIHEREANRFMDAQAEPVKFQKPVAEEPESYVVLPDPEPVSEPAPEPHSPFSFAAPVEHSWTMPEPAAEPASFAAMPEPAVTAEPAFAAPVPHSFATTTTVPESVPVPEHTSAWESRAPEREPEPMAAQVPMEPPPAPAVEPVPTWPLTVPGPSTPEWPSSRASSTAPRFAMLRAVAQRWNQPLSERRFLIAAGSRAEARRLAPVIRTLRARGVSAHGLEEVCVCAAGDDPQSVREALELLDISVDCHLSVEGVNQSLDALRARLLNSFESVFAQVKPQWLVVAGDTMMTGMAALAAYYAGIHVARVDAGHTTSTAGDELQPDEIYRQLVDLFSAVHFTETEWSKERLIHEGVLEENILVTGNTGVDALYESCQRLNLPLGPLSSRSSGVSRVLVSVGHRSLPDGSAGEICRAIGNLAVLVPGLYEFTWPLPPGPEASESVHRILGRVPGVRLTPPASYEEFLRHLSHCDFVLTDSPDLLEEAPSLGKPVLLLGAAGQRNEAIRTGVAIPVTPDSKSIQVAVRGLARKLSTRHGQITNPYGDGKASARIADFFEGRRILEFGHTALPRLTDSNDGPLRIADPVTRWRLES